MPAQLAIHPIIPNPRMFPTTYGLLLLPLGLVFGAKLALVGVNAALILLSKRPIVIFTRKAMATAPS